MLFDVRRLAMACDIGRMLDFIGGRIKHADMAYLGRRTETVRGRLTLRRMFETAVGNGTQKLRLEQEIAETGRVNADIGALLVDIVASGGSIGLLAVGRGRGLVGRELLIGVVDEILLGRHVGGCEKCVLNS